MSEVYEGSDRQRERDAGMVAAALAFCKVRHIAFIRGFHFAGDYYFMVSGANAIYKAEITPNSNGGAGALVVGECRQFGGPLVHGLISAALKEGTS